MAAMVYDVMWMQLWVVSMHLLTHFVNATQSLAAEAETQTRGHVPLPSTVPLPANYGISSSEGRVGR